MFHLVLHQPEIPPNTGNLIRLAANTGVTLHLIHPLGFYLRDKDLQRAGLDYHEWSRVQEHSDFAALQAALPQARIWAFSTKARCNYAEARYAPGDILLFGSETRGLPPAVLDAIPEAQRLRLPMQPDSRSLNLANAAAIAVYEAWRQQGFAGAA
ncbi:MAG: tRNA (cytidine(34)-2'-O)-methyltransferase [Stagnimonas sp.]|nr:tRNA (cytidine(34)-2'-O)-methyltransferase [Stagnimonas sp.]